VKEVVPAALDGERVDRIVSLLLGISRAEATRLVEQGSVHVDGQVAGAGKRRVHAAQTVEIRGELESAGGPEPEAKVDVPVVFSDDAVIVVDKPAGLVVHPAAGNVQGTLVNGLLARFPSVAGVGQPDRPGIVHRLDAGTSGLMVVAHTNAAYASLVDQLRRRVVTREYEALAWGEPGVPSGLIEAPVGRSRRDPTRMAVTADGREARTRYTIERVFHEPVTCALWRCRLETGRTHQIRVHLAAVGHPVVGDARYGGVRAGLSCPRPFLHAARLSFRHPETGEELSFTSPLPADLQTVLDGVS
jgi:23S rRNA pseudouridine1911/1915/1917 synthase